ncbi:hypothetical protein [Nakamurella aerolata]|uniref:Uncharacterized protein n=1 Tax=Nakamurella aerolata TaxID=1656892 RepID=A0A849AH06_9ACTN|nr:hypothetical protein [Nakamurella aerolata]NNG36132.1 hypothetical protein [Nakamurella aerolata]
MSSAGAAKGSAPARPRHAGNQPGVGKPRPLRHAVLDALSVPWNTLRCLGRHFPTLFVIALAGQLAHDRLIDLAVWVSRAGGIFGQLVLVLAPLSVLTSYVLILRVIRPSLPTVRELTSTRPDGALPTARRFRLRRLVTELDELGALLIPFLVVYSTAGQLRNDAIAFNLGVTNDVADNLMVHVNDADVSAAQATASADQVARTLGSDTNIWLWVLIVTAFAVRTALPWLIKNVRWGLLGFVAAYAEALWMVSAAPLLNGLRSHATDWVTGRKIVAWTQQTMHSFTDLLGPLTGVANTVITVLGKLIGSAGTLLLVPLAWLSIGAVVFGQLIDAGPRTERTNWMTRARLRFNRRMSSLDQRAQRAAGELTSGLSGRFGQIVTGVRTIIGSGGVAMVLFCMLFQAAQLAGGGLWMLERAIIGPQEPSVWIALGDTGGPLRTLNNTLVTMLLLCLVGAGTDRALHGRLLRRRAEQAAPTSAESTDQHPPAPPTTQPAG